MHFSFKKIPKSKEMMHELIEKYFENQLTEAEKLEFDKLLAEDADFKQELEFYSELKNAVTVSERQKLKKEIQQFETVSNRPVFHLKRYFPYAAVLLVMLTLWFVLFSNNTTSNTDLYNSYFDAYPNTEISNTRSDINEKTALEEAFIAYDLEEYAKANTLFDLALKISRADYIQFYKAMSLMKLEQHTEALEILQNVNWSEAYNEKALWYKSLCHLKLNQIKEAKKELTILIKKGTFKNTEAIELLDKL